MIQLTKKKKLVFVSGPLETSGPLWKNVRTALYVGDFIHIHGGHAFVPHLAVSWAMSTPIAEERDREQWMDWCFTMLSRCDAIYRIPGISAGADREVVYAQDCGIPVFNSKSDLSGWLKDGVGAELAEPFLSSTRALEEEQRAHQATTEAARKQNQADAAKLRAEQKAHEHRHHQAVTSIALVANALGIETGSEIVDCLAKIRMLRAEILRANSQCIDFASELEEVRAENSRLTSNVFDLMGEP